VSSSKMAKLLTIITFSIIIPLWQKRQTDNLLDFNVTNVILQITSLLEIKLMLPKKFR